MLSLYLTAFLATAGLTDTTNSQSRDLKFDDTIFAYQSSKTENLTGTPFIKHSYQAASPSKHACTISVTEKTKATVDGVLGVDRAVMMPAVTVVPLEIVKNPVAPNDNDAASVILFKNHKDPSKYTVILHRANMMPGGVLRDTLIQCTEFKYEGVFSKSIAQFDKLKSAWIRELFELDPQLSKDDTVKPQP